MNNGRCFCSVYGPRRMSDLLSLSNNKLELPVYAQHGRADARIYFCQGSRQKVFFISPEFSKHDLLPDGLGLVWLVLVLLDIILLFWIWPWSAWLGSPWLDSLSEWDVHLPSHGGIGHGPGLTCLKTTHQPTNQAANKRPERTEQKRKEQTSAN